VDRIGPAINDVEGKIKMRWILFSIQFVLVLAISPVAAFGALGGNVASIQADQVKMKATVRVARTETSYTVHEIQTPTGTSVREFVGRNGTVFAVAWKGSVVPDLRQVLGSYFASFTQSAKVKGLGHNHLLIRQPGFVIHASGHTRAFSGSAYVPGLLPPGVSAQEIF